MKTATRILVTASLVFPSALLMAKNAEPEPGVPVHQVQSAPAAQPARQENQQLYGAAGATIIAPEVARGVVEKFREVYGRENAPRILIYVNRDLVDTQSGMKLTGHTEKYETTSSEVKSDVEAPARDGAPQTQVNVAVGGGNAGSGALAPAGKGTTTSDSKKTSGENTYKTSESTTVTLADRQTVREVERLFGRPFRVAGARLSDQGVAVAMMADKPVGYLAGASDQAAKDREALGKVADIVVEVLISSRSLSVPSVSGDATSMTVPDIQTTAIRLDGAGIIGQASASDVLGKDRQAGRLVKQFDVRDITEATALALMEDMLADVPPAK